MKHATGWVLTIVLVSLMCLAPGYARASDAQKVLDSYGSESGLFVVVACGDAGAAEMATDLGKNGNSLVHVIAGDKAELASIKKAIAAAGVKGCVTVEQLGVKTLPYRDYMVNVIVVMDIAKASQAGFSVKEAKRCLAPYGRLITCSGGKIKNIEEIQLPENMDIWTHRYHGADGRPVSTDKVFDLPVGFKWSAGLPMNFDNPERSANRYSSTRALALNDGRCFTFSTGVVENLGDGWKSKYGTAQYLTCRDAFNGRMLWRKRIGDTYYGGLYIENMAPMISIGQHVYLAGENGKMLVISTRTGKTLRELPTAYIPGVISASRGIVVVTTWKGGKSMGSVKRYDRRRMDWAIAEGTVEAYDDKTGKQLWKNDLLGTALLIAESKVYIVNRDANDTIEEKHNRRNKNSKETRPAQRVIAMDLTSGKVLWKASDESFKGKDKPINLEAAGYGAVAVSYGNRNTVALLSAGDGTVLQGNKAATAGKNFFRFRGHICTPVMRVGDIQLNNRGGTITKGNERQSFGGARAGCLTGTVPGYGAGYISQNWCRCSPGQIPGLLAIASIGKIPTPEEMEVATKPVQFTTYNEAVDNISSPSMWSSFRGNATRSSSAGCDISSKPNVVWSKKLTARKIVGTVQRDWKSFLNTRLTAPITAGDLVIMADIDHNELIAVDASSGNVKWRFMTGGRMDTAPTLYKGVCLAGDRTGYVYAIKAKTGKLIYKLRIAPSEKRMVSYGKVESVWPVIGGVMVAKGKAYASAGRTQGSDGGLLVRAFVPETGKVLWSRAIPQGGGRSNKRNDALALADDAVTVMGHRLSLDKGDNISAGRKGGGLTIGLEGVYSWNWTRLGHRKFQTIGYGGARGDTVSWSDKYVAVCDMRNGLSLSAVENGKPKGKKWSLAVARDRQVTSLIICNNVVVIGGAITDQGKLKGFVQAIGVESGKVVWDKTFGAKLAFNGLAIDGGKIIASFDDGSVACLK
ncbi:MAG: PQQ-binding-like beta-propeller repeat protein [Phycisphaerae bacterium]|jgi:outer membrane protein assembly factor BamB|nr:PQQ-binding-like beta-propeller repeat protein [Phycisphaerae bacterium]